MLAWTDALAELARWQTGRIMVVGPPDAGKSTFCRSLMASMAERGGDAGLLDLDVGQKTVGPPACVTAGHGGREAELGLAGLAFVGTTNPLQGWRRILEGTSRLLGNAGALAVINTSGLIGGAGSRLKAAKIALIKPDLLVAIGEDDELDEIRSRHPKCAVWRLPTAPGGVRKSQAQRRAARRNAFREYFSAAPARDLSLAGWTIEEAADPEGVPQGLLVGIADSAGEDLAMGLVVEVDAPGSRLRLICPVQPPAEGALRLGRLRLDDDWGEHPWPGSAGSGKHRAV